MMHLPHSTGLHAGESVLLTEEEEQRLARLWRDHRDVEAVNQLIRSHLGLVVKIALDLRHSGLALDDLIQEGNLGLTIAARRFDPARGNRLSTYAAYWIRAMMLEMIVRGHGPLRIGTTRSQRKVFFGLSRARWDLERDGEAATPESLAQALGVDREDVTDMLPRLSRRDLSLDAPRYEDDSLTFGSTLASPHPSAEEELGELELETRRRALLDAAIGTLSEREQALMRARHLGENPATLESLGQAMGISRERVRQLEVRATEKMRQYLVTHLAAA